MSGWDQFAWQIQALILQSFKTMVPFSDRSNGHGRRKVVKKLWLILAVAAITLLLGSCSSVSYVTDWDTQHDFSGNNSYAWYELPQRAGNTTTAPAPPLAPNAMVASRIRRSVTAELNQRGLQAAAAGDADLLVTYSIALQQNMQVYHSGWGYPYHGCWGWGGGWGGGGYSSARMVTRGTLIVDILDAKRRGLIWRGIAEGAFSKSNPSESEVAKIVAKLMLDFPPA